MLSVARRTDKSLNNEAFCKAPGLAHLSPSGILFAGEILGANPTYHKKVRPKCSGMRPPPPNNERGPGTGRQDAARGIHRPVGSG